MAVSVVLVVVRFAFLWLSARIIRLLDRRPLDDDDPALRQHEQYTALRLAALAHKRAAVLQLRDQQHIDDTVPRQIQARLDLQELGLSRRQPVD